MVSEVGFEHMPTYVDVGLNPLETVSESHHSAQLKNLCKADEQLYNLGTSHHSTMIE